MMQKKKYGTTLALAALMLAGCRGGGFLSSDTVAEVGDAVLTETEVAASIPPGTATGDSILLADGYVSAWVRKQLKLQEAERVLERNGVDIEAMVNDYRNTLLSLRLDQYYVDSRIDPEITDSLVNEYYEKHGGEFVLDRNIVKGTIVRLPASFRQRASLKKAMGSSDAERRQDFTDMVVKNDLKLIETDGWVSQDEFLDMLPTVRGRSYDDMLRSKGVSEMADGDTVYFILVSDYRAKGQQAPLEWVSDAVRKIIYNRRSSDIVKAVEDSLYDAALRNNTLKIKTNNR